MRHLAQAYERNILALELLVWPSSVEICTEVHDMYLNVLSLQLAFLFLPRNQIYLLVDNINDVDPELNLFLNAL